MRGLAAGVGVVALYNGSGPAPFDSIRRVVQNQNKQNVVSKPQTMNEVIADSLAPRRFFDDPARSLCRGGAAAGEPGTLRRHFLSRRSAEHELGIRLALGAQRKDVLRLVLSHGMRMALGGVALVWSRAGPDPTAGKDGLRVSTTDPATFTVIALLLTAVALLACFVPARRATKWIRWWRYGTNRNVECEFGNSN